MRDAAADGHLRGDGVVDDEAVGRRLHVDRGPLGRPARLRRGRGGREVLGDRDDGRVGAVGEALRGVVRVGDRPGEVARLGVRALDESGGELAAERHVLVVDRDGLVLVHDGGVQPVESLDRVVERGDEDAADHDGQQQHADEGEPGDGATRARPFDGEGHAVRGHESTSVGREEAERSRTAGTGAPGLGEEGPRDGRDRPPRRGRSASRRRAARRRRGRGRRSMRGRRRRR